MRRLRRIGAATLSDAMQKEKSMIAKDDDQDALAAQWAASLGTEEEGGGADALAAELAASLAADEQASVKKQKEQAAFSSQAKVAEFQDLSDEAKAPRSDANRRELDFILDIPLDVSAELGRTRLLINELLQLGQGSVVELNKLAGEPLEVYVNGKMVARGEAVVINEKFGIRLTDIISPMERVKQLG
jgi:flagellar motor switch protein FliN/FliY